MSKMKKCIPIVVFLLLMTVGISKAEPTPTISYLMNTPVSMLDFGIYRLERSIFENRDELAIGKHKPIVKVQYSYDLNRIEIILKYAILEKDDIKDMQTINVKLTLEIYILKLKFLGFGLDADGKPIPGQHSATESLFHHVGYASKDEPKNIGKELDQITEIHVEFFNGKEWFRCKSPLIGNKIYWEK